MLIMALIAKPFSQDGCGIDCCILIAGEVAEGGFGINFLRSKNSPSICLQSYSMLSFHPKSSLSLISSPPNYAHYLIVASNG
jgi:hypothetical protein